MITYQLEDWATYRAGCHDLWVEHYDEIAGDKTRMAMRPDEQLYLSIQNAGQLQILTAREAGAMIGYMLFMIKVHPHYADVLCGFEDAYFLSKAKRKGAVGIKLIRNSIYYMKKRGVKRIFIHTKKSKDVGKVLSFLGLTHTDEIYSAWIGD